MKLQENKTYIMGVLNVTPDSFSDGGQFIDPSLAVQRAKQMINEGADIIDIGGESSRPGSQAISVEEELKRVLPVITTLAKEITNPISIDTKKPEVAKACLEAGATIVNDISGLSDNAMAKIAAEHNATVVIMHMQGTPESMQEKPEYTSVIDEISDFFKERIAVAKEAGVQNIILDPGIGFGKKLEHNLEILCRLDEFKTLDCPILIGTSRKSFIGTLTGQENAAERIEGTIASNTIAIMNGANIIRVHDVLEAKRALQVTDAICMTK